MRYFETSTIYHYPWEHVAQGLWRRYPNPFSTHVQTEDTIFREVKDGKLYSKRLLKKSGMVPKWGKRFAGSLSALIIEESIVDPKEKTVTTYTRNIYERALNIVEKVTYQKSQDNDNWTVAHRSAWVDSQVRGFSSCIVAFGVATLRMNFQKAVKGFNHVLEKMFPHAEENASYIAKKTEQIRDAAKIASDLAKSKAATVMVSCEANES